MSLTGFKYFRTLRVLLLIAFSLACSAYIIWAVCRQDEYGLEGKYFENMQWEGSPSIVSLDTSINSYTLAVQRKKLPQNKYSVEWRGYINIPETDTYTFFLQSDDGSWLFIDENLVVDNGGIHGLIEQQGEVSLQKGLYPIRIRYFQSGSYAVLRVFFKTNTTEKALVPENMWLPPQTNSEAFFIYRYGKRLLPFWGILGGISLAGLAGLLLHKSEYVFIIVFAMMAIFMFKVSISKDREYLGNEFRHFFRGVDFFVSLICKEDKTQGLFLRDLFGGKEISVYSPLPYVPFYLQSAYTPSETNQWKLHYEFGANEWMSVSKRFHGIGIQSRAPGTPFSFFVGAFYVLLAQNGSSISLNLLNPWVAYHLTNILFSFGLAFVGMWFVFRISHSFWLAFATFLSLHLEPMLLGESVTCAHNMPITFFLLAALVLYYLAVKDSSKKKWVFSAIFAGLALASKPQAVLVPFLLGLWKYLVILMETKERTFKGYMYHLFRVAAEFTLYGLLMATVFYVCFPNIWLTPVSGFFQHFFWLRDALSVPKNTFFITPRTALPFWAYFVFIPMHLSEISLALTLCILFVILYSKQVKGFIVQHHSLLLLVLWLGVNFIFISRENLKKIAVFVPLLPSLLLLMYLLSFFFYKNCTTFRLTKIVPAICTICLLGQFSFTIIGGYPDYTFHYNKLFDHGKMIKTFEFLGTDILCGVRAAAKYLQSQHAEVIDSVEDYMLSGYFPEVYEVYDYGHVTDFEEYSKKHQYLTMRAVTLQRYPYLPLVIAAKNIEPENIISFHGKEFFYIYKVERFKSFY